MTTASEKAASAEEKKRKQGEHDSLMQVRKRGWHVRGEKRNCAWKAGTEARVPGGGLSGPEGEGLNSRGLLSPRYQSAEASQAVPEPTHTLTLTGSASRMKDGEAKIKMSEWKQNEEEEGDRGK